MADNHIFSYTKRSYENSRKEGLAKIPMLSSGTWTDLNATDPGIIMLDYVHALVDLVNYYQDHQAMETFLSTAKERANIFRIAKQLSYNIRSAKGALCEVLFTSRIYYERTIKIPKYTQVTTSSGIPYLTTEDAYLLPGEFEVTVNCSQGRLNTLTYTGTGLSRFSTIENPINQSIRLQSNNIDVDSITIVDANNNPWSPVDYLVFSGESDKVYQVVLNPDDSVSILFGDGQRGYVPNTSDTLNITYIETLAEEGRIGAGEIISLSSSIYDEDKYIPFSVSNIKSSTGGSRSQSSQEIKELAPGAIKAQDRAVTLSDFENLAKLVDGVLDAKAFDINIKPDLCLYHEVKLLIVPEDNISSLEALKNQVYDYLSKKLIPPTSLQIIYPGYIEIDINTIIGRKLDSVVESRLRYSVEQALIKFFDERKRAVGEPFYDYELRDYLRTIEGVRDILSIEYEIKGSISDTSILVLSSKTPDIVWR